MHNMLCAGFAMANPADLVLLNQLPSDYATELISHAFSAMSSFRSNRRVNRIRKLAYLGKFMSVEGHTESAYLE